VSRAYPTVKEFLAAGSESLEENFFRLVWLPNGTFKTTQRRRLDDLNEFCLPFLQALPARPLRIMDVAASSGATTAEWQAQLERSGLACAMTATDKWLNASLVRLLPGMDALVGEDGSALHFDAFGFGMSSRVSITPLSPVKVALWALFKLFYSAKKKTALPVVLARPAAGLRVEPDDLLAPTPPPWAGAFDVVRAANILNRGYFTGSELSAILVHLRERLRPGGVLVASRTDESSGKNMATLFRHEQGRFSVLARLNGGSEIEELAAPQKKANLTTDERG
jgi:hypothetical protein